MNERQMETGPILKYTNVHTHTRIDAVCITCEGHTEWNLHSNFHEMEINIWLEFV